MTRKRKGFHRLAISPARGIPHRPGNRLVSALFCVFRAFRGSSQLRNLGLKRRLEQPLLLRGGRDFETVEHYDQFVAGVVRAAKAPRPKALAEELASLRPLPAGRLAEYREFAPVVSSRSLIRVNRHTYSVPSRLMGHTLRVQQHEAELRGHWGREHLFDLPRRRGDRGCLVDFRHVLPGLLRKPGAFSHYRHREALLIS